MLVVMPEEMEIVSQMQVVDREAFFYLAGRMDVKTGVIGREGRCRVSYGGMALDLSERTRPGRPKELITFSSKQIEHAVERLVRAGIFQRLSASGRGCDLILRRVFFAESANAHSSVQNEYGRVMGGYREVDSINNSKNINNIDNNTGSNKGGISQEFGTTNIHQYQHSAEQPFSMTLEWSPTDNDLKAILFRAFGSRFRYEDIDPSWIAEFVSYWWGQQGRRYTQQQWTGKLGSQIIRYFKMPGEFERLHGMNPQKDAVRKKPTHIERNNRSLPTWASPPMNDNALVGWMQRHGYGDAPPGYDYDQTRGWLRREIDKRMAANNLPKIVH